MVDVPFAIAQVQPVTMNPDDFVSRNPENRLLSHNRLTSNWVVERQRHLTEAKFMALHRVSPKRVILEVAPTVSRRRLPTLVLMLCAALTLAGLLSMYSSVTSKQVRSVSASVSPSVESCQSPNLAGHQFDSIVKFSYGGWTANGKPMGDLIGQLQSFEFDAQCSNKSISGKLVAAFVSDKWLVKRMVLTN